MVVTLHKLSKFCRPRISFQLFCRCQTFASTSLELSSNGLHIHLIFYTFLISFIFFLLSLLTHAV